MNKSMTLEEARQQIIKEATAIADEARDRAVAFAIAQINGDFIRAFPMRLPAFLAMRKQQEPGVSGVLDTHEEVQPVSMLYGEWTAMERWLADAPVH